MVKMTSKTKTDLKNCHFSLFYSIFGGILKQPQEKQLSEVENNLKRFLGNFVSEEIFIVWGHFLKTPRKLAFKQA